MARKNRNKPEEKPMDFLDQFGTLTITEEPKTKEPKVEQQVIVEEPAATEEPVIPEAPKTYKVKVTHPSLRMRRAPNTQAEVYDLITDQGIYEIVDEVNGWGKLENGCWIMLSYTEIV